MKLLLIRHGEPDYENDTLTEKGRREAECLAGLLSEQLGPKCIARNGSNNADQGAVYFYVSPYGRAQETAAATLRKLGRTAETLPWLREFDAFIHRPDCPDDMRVPWDWLPQDWTQDERFYLKDRWHENEYMVPEDVGGQYREVTEQFDELLAKHGYRREGRCYRAERSNHDTIVLFCHFGVSSVLLSHLWSVSPMVIWHGFCAQTSSVTTLVTEERREGIASFRMLAYGDTTHLYINGEEPAFAARFCECYEDDTRHD